METATSPYHNLTMLNYKYWDEYKPEDHDLLRRVNTVAMLVYTLIFVLGTTGNGLVIFITGFRMKKTVHTIWILSLAISDFTFSFFLIFHIVFIALEYYWPFGYFMCKLNYAVVFFNIFTSIYLLVVISVDRCISVRCPVWAQNHRTPRLASFVVLGVWLLALVFFAPDLYFMETFSTNIANASQCTNTYDISDEGARRSLSAVVLLRFIVGFTIPFVVIVICYGAIAVRLTRDQLSRASRPFKVITAVIVAFFLCWFPYHIFSFLAVKAIYEPNIQELVSTGLLFAYSLAYFNSCLNPILYFCMGYNFKEKLRCSLLSALVNAFTDDNFQNSRKASAGFSAELELNRF